MDDTVLKPAASIEPVIDAEGHFHATDAPIDLSHYLFEDWITLALFWLLGLNVFYQFFTRYVLNDSAAWTEEIARYLLIAIVFVGIAAATRRTRHIHVDFVYRLIPKPLGRAFSTLIDLLRIVFFAVAVWLTYEMMGRMGYYMMTVIDLPVNIVYGFCLFGFAAATVRSVQVAIENWRRGWSLLERPEHAIEETA
jgi:TRAP-type C4-dicarboxylate transport system permease small subunit